MMNNRIIYLVLAVGVLLLAVGAGLLIFDQPPSGGEAPVSLVTPSVAQPSATSSPIMPAADVSPLNSPQPQATATVGLERLPTLPATEVAAEPIATDAPSDVTLVSIKTLREALEGADPPLVWEFRSAERYAGEHVPGSQLVQYLQIEQLSKELDPAAPIVTLCG